MKQKVVIIGGGVIGLSIAWQLLKRGFFVEVYNRDHLENSTSWVSAGMLSPFSEAYFEELTLFNLCKESFYLYPKFLDELKEDTGIELKIDKCGSLIIGFNRDDVERIRRIFNFYEQNNFPVSWLDGEEIRQKEPCLSPKTIAGIWIPEEGEIDNRTLIHLLKNAVNKLGGKILDGISVNELEIKNYKASRIILDNECLDVSNCFIVIAAGAWSKKIKGIPEYLLPPVRPVKGQIVALVSKDSYKLSHIIRAPDVYLTPKSDGRLLIGASNEDVGFDLKPTAGEIMWLLRRGWEAAPSIYDLEIKEIKVGLRPATPDNCPIVSDTEIENLFYATGHYRHGILLAPITSYAISHLLVSKFYGKDSNIGISYADILTNFHLSRFYKKT
ncbi:MAG: glycine oxidase ThiO [Melioribacter sp.]|nr:glycine oxidase ThiO [Melioribacter sp.]